MPDLGLTHIALPVSSLDASIGFYARYAAMQVVHRRPGVAWLSDKTRPFVIVLVESTIVAHPLLPLAHLGVAVASREEVNRLSDLARSEACLVYEPEDAGPPVGYFAFIRDPDGHTLELAHGQEVSMAVGKGI